MALTPAEEADLNARANLSRNLDPLIAAVEKSPGFAGIYLDQHDGGRIVISYVAGTTPPASEIDASLPAGAQYRLRTVAFTMAELRGVRDAISDLMVSGAAPAATIYVSADPITDRVEVGLYPYDAVAATWFTEKFGPTIAAVASPQPSPASCLSRADCPAPIKGGLDIYSRGISSDNHCTSGFMARKSVNPVANTWYLITAGHCIALAGGIGDIWWHGTSGGNGAHSIGDAYVYEYQNGGSSDSGIIKMYNLAFPSNEVFANSPTDIRNITTGAYNSNQLVGDPVCRAGARSNNYLCGTITHADTSFSPQTGMVFLHQWEMSRAVVKGDSGGSVMYSTTAFGILHTALGTRTWYSTIDWISNDTGFRPCFTAYNNPC